MEQRLQRNHHDTSCASSASCKIWHLQDAEIVEQMVSGTYMVVDVLARQLLLSRCDLPVDAVKRVPRVQSSKLFGMAKELQRGKKAKVVLRTETAGPKAPHLIRRVQH